MNYSLLCKILCFIYLAKELRTVSKIKGRKHHPNPSSPLPPLQVSRWCWSPSWRPWSLCFRSACCSSSPSSCSPSSGWSSTWANFTWRASRSTPVRARASSSSLYSLPHCMWTHRRFIGCERRVLEVGLHLRLVTDSEAFLLGVVLVWDWTDWLWDFYEDKWRLCQ